MKAAIRIVPQGEIAQGTIDPPAYRLPPRDLFADRAARLRMLAARDPAAGGYLDLMASLAEAQHACMRGEPTWREALGTIIERLAPRLPEATAAMLRGLRGAADGYLENLGERVRDFDYPSVDARLVPFVGAALQVEWARRAAAATVLAGASVAPNLCPVCNSPAMASILRIDAGAPGSRYLHCPLCATEWHLGRGQCTHCGNREKLGYYHIEGGSEAVKAEGCDECHGYLKVFNHEKDPLADPVADDLATLALDVLMDESGYQRAGPNLFFVPGQT